MHVCWRRCVLKHLPQDTHDLRDDSFLRHTLSTDSAFASQSHQENPARFELQVLEHVQILP